MTTLRALDDEGVEEIHQAALRVLAETGVRLTHARTRELLLEHGAKAEKDRVLVPSDLVERSLAECPRTVTLRGRGSSIELGSGDLHTHNVGGVPSVHEPGGTRPAAREDNAAAARLLDAMPNVTSVTPMFTPRDVPAASMTAWMYYDAVRSTLKPVRGPGLQNRREAAAVAELAAIAGVDATADFSPISPLSVPDGIAEAVLEAAGSGLPLGPLPCPIAGLTAPMTMAGALAQQHAEVLVFAVIGELARPGLPFVYHGRLSMMDPFTACSVWGGPEIGLVSAAAVRLARRCRLPVNVYGLCTDSHTSDIQSGYERALNALPPVLAGADEISGVGELEAGRAASPAQIVIDDEILGSVRRLQRGIAVNEETLAGKLIADVARKSGNFLTEKHSAKHLRLGELMIPKLASRDDYAGWKASGAKTLAERAEEKAREVLGEHEVEPLGDRELAEMRKVIDALEREAG